MKSTYTTSKAIALSIVLIGAVGWTIAIYSSPSGFQIDSTVIILAVILLYMVFDLMWGTYVSINDNIVIRTDNFFMKNKVLIQDIDIVRYQPTYGVGKEASSLYIFKKNQSTAVFTMTNLWFGEKRLSQFAKDLRRTNSGIKFDDETQALMEKYQRD
jgi:hypothetical protein